MPPKARARGARPLRRPAAAGVARGALRRPAGLDEAEAPAGGTLRLRDLGVAALHGLGHIWLKGAKYYQKEIDLVGKVSGVRLEASQTYLDVEASGTKDEALLRALSGRPSRLVAVHVCGADCEALLTEEFLVHGDRYEAVSKDDLPWYSNLVKVARGEEPPEDEMRELRRAAESREAEKRRGGVSPPKKEKKRKTKKDKEEKAGEEAAGSKKRALSSESEEKEPGQKDLVALFAGTGLDPSGKARKKIMRKARRLGRKKRSKKRGSSCSKSTSSPSSASRSSSPGPDRGGLFNSEKRMKVIWRHYPGTLACSAVQDARESLLTSSGTLWEVSRKRLPPLMTQFTRQQLVASMSPPMMQEALTISCCIDGLLQGKVASTCDVLCQRLKSLESLSRGSHWTVARQLELIRSDPGSITGEAENLDAAKRAREEEKLRSSMTRPQGARGGDLSGGAKGKKGKEWKGSGKGGADDGARGKGGGGKNEKKGKWQKPAEGEK